jgi:nucleotide-binding universal stress UspA family protein
LFPTKILLAVDGSVEAALAAREAVELASGTDSELHVVHVVSTVPELLYPRASARKRSEALLEWKRLGDLTLLDNRVRWMEELLGGSIAASQYREGRLEKEVVRLGKELDAGLIVSDGRRRLWLAQIFEAGFSENLSRQADRPVLVVSEPGLRRSSVPR